MNRPGLSLIAEKKDGTLNVDRERLQRYLQTLKDGKYEISVERWVSSRSARQNRAYWSCIVTPISEHTGYERDEVHELLKRYCNPKTVELVNPRTGETEETVVGGSTAGLNAEEFNEFFRRCQQWAAERLDCECPDPDPEYAFNKTTAA